MSCSFLTVHNAFLTQILKRRSCSMLFQNPIEHFKHPPKSITAHFVFLDIRPTLRPKKHLRSCSFLTLHNPSFSNPNTQKTPLLNAVTKHYRSLQSPSKKMSYSPFADTTDAKRIFCPFWLFGRIWCFVVVAVTHFLEGDRSVQ